MRELWTEIKDNFSWWMIPVAFILIIICLSILISLAPDDLIPREYEVH